MNSEQDFLRDFQETGQATGTHLGTQEVLGTTSGHLTNPGILEAGWIGDCWPANKPDYLKMDQLNHAWYLINHYKTKEKYEEFKKYLKFIYDDI